MNKPPVHVEIAHYGTWKSPITAEKIAEGASSIIYMLLDGNETYLCELRPSNKGRYTIVKCDGSGRCEDMTPKDFNVRSSVHEYGGAPFALSKGTIYATNGADHALYQICPGKEPKQLTAGQVYDTATHTWSGTRFADLHVTQLGIVAIGERHEAKKPVENFLALIDPSTGKQKILASGYDFYSSPAISANGKKIAWICWNHPQMPWRNNELWVAELSEDGTLQNKQKVAGDFPEAIFQPQWSPDEVLYFVTDRDKGWWNIHRFSDGQIENICPIEAEVGEPQWLFGKSTYAFLNNKIVFSYNKEGSFYLGILDPKTKIWQKIPHQSAYIEQMRSGKECVRFLESFTNKEKALVQLDNATGYPIKTILSKPPLVTSEYISQPVHMAFQSSGHIAYGFFYPPFNKNYKAPSGERPPLVVMIHGGPTSQAKAEFSLSKQFWTSRGYAVFDINYAGSTGYGRNYRHLLDGKWGILDVEDCANGALWLVKQGLVDGNRLLIRGGSAGGYTTLAALAFKDIFKAGASYYGVADITALASDTHKFESHYMESLVGKYPEEKKIWEERSPINSVEKITSPLILFQGENDTVVPKSQSIMIYEALKKRNIPVELHIYPEEEHGFRQASSIIHSLTHEAEFYQKLFGLNSSTS
jgi:dipeptidyl aminopeptidase/acylaminoacyl peptidase